MGRIFILMGKSASGKDSLRKKILEDMPELRKYIPYTTRPIREGERAGDDYFYVTEGELERLAGDGRLIESRTYDTVHGPWVYATVEDGQIDLSAGDYLMEGTLEAYLALKDYYGDGNVVPIYVEVDDGVRLLRALEREKAEAEPRYEELCRRFIADSADYSEEKLRAAGIGVRYANDDLASCAARIGEAISMLRSEE